MDTKAITALILPALSHPGLFRVTRQAAGTITIFRIAVHGADYGRVCGRKGRNLECLAKILEPIDGNARVVLDPPLTSDLRQTIPQNPEWNPAPVVAMLRKWIRAAEFPGNVEISETARAGGVYDVIFTVQPDEDILNALAKWTSAVASAHGGKICIHGAHYADAVPA